MFLSLDFFSQKGSWRLRILRNLKGTADNLSDVDEEIDIEKSLIFKLFPMRKKHVTSNFALVSWNAKRLKALILEKILCKICVWLYFLSQVILFKTNNEIAIRHSISPFGVCFVYLIWNFGWNQWNVFCCVSHVIDYYGYHGPAKIFIIIVGCISKF